MFSRHLLIVFVSFVELCAPYSLGVIHRVRVYTLSAQSPKPTATLLPDLSQSSFPVPPINGYDIVVLGSGPGGETVAVLSAQLGNFLMGCKVSSCSQHYHWSGAKVAIVEKKSTFGGPTGNQNAIIDISFIIWYITTGLTSKAVREAAKRICKAVDQVGGDRRRQIQSLWKKR